MRMTVIINGRIVGQLEYELPKGEDGKEIPTPPMDGTSEILVVIEGPKGMRWQGRGKVEAV